MEVGVVYDDSHVTNVLDDSLSWVPNSSSPSFHGSAATMVNFEDGSNSERQFLIKTHIGSSTKSEKLDEDDDEYDECFHHKPGKKRRLMPEQVQYLEKSFDVENKLEPERKSQLAKQLGLQPRQVAIWFQNRRARSKTKVLEKEYVSLKASYDKLKADYDTLFEENDKMKNEVHLLTEKLRAREKLSDPINIPLDLLPKKQELASNVDASSSAKSDVFDSESPHYALEGATDYSSHVFEFEASDFSQDEDDDAMRRGLVPKIEAEEDDLQPNSSNLGFPVQHQGTWLWQY